MTEQFDLVIAGGGPSGSAAAWQAVQTGAKVVILDKATFPRDKPCGDGLTARAVSYLQKMGLADEVARFHRVNRVTVYSPSRWELSFPKRPGMPDHGHTVSRTVLDTLLLEHADKAGAVVRQGAEVSDPIIDERGRVTSRKHFFLDGRPSANPGGYPHEIRMTYGEDGRLATQTFLNETGGFATALGPVGRMAMRYDAMGNLLSQTFFGVTGVPVESAIGCHEVRFAYDTRNRLSSVECRSGAGDLKVHKDWRQNGIDWPAGAARMVVERGEVLVNSYSAPDGRVVRRVECRKLEQLCYR